MTTASMPLFYNSVVALDRKAHQRLRITPPNEFSFAAAAALVPVLTGEFGLIAREYALVFMGAGTKEVVPVALTGMPQSKNLFVRADGSWDARYVPAYARRYPFVFVETAAEQFTVPVSTRAPNSSAKRWARPCSRTASRPRYCRRRSICWPIITA